MNFKVFYEIEKKQFIENSQQTTNLLFLIDEFNDELHIGTI